MNEINLSIPAEPSSPAEARHALDPLAGTLEEPLLDDLRLLVTELVTNSVRHSGAHADAHVGVSVSVAPEVVRVEVSDAGSGFELDRRQPQTVAAPYEGPERRHRGAARELRVGGLGLYMVERLSDRWGVRHQGRVRVWFELERARARASACGA